MKMPLSYRIQLAKLLVDALYREAGDGKSYLDVARDMLRKAQYAEQGAKDHEKYSTAVCETTLKKSNHAGIGLPDIKLENSESEIETITDRGVS